MTYPELRGKVIGIGLVDLLTARKGMCELVMVCLMDLLLEDMGRGRFLLLERDEVLGDFLIAFTQSAIMPLIRNGIESGLTTKPRIL